ncbi:MAG: hypothetical protein ABR905_03950 [Terracidiphilus sp.]
MRAQSIGRALGIGLRVASRVVGQRLAGGDQVAETHAGAKTTAPNRFDGTNAGKKADGRAVGHAAAVTGRGVVRGVGGFLRPFYRVGGILWLEVTGVFFLLFVVVFAPTLWRTRASWSHGPDHRLFLVTAGVMAVFLYLSVSSFWRARKR